MKKFAFVFILISICLLSASTISAEQFSYSFETSDDAFLWSGGVFDDSNPFETGYSLYVNNPFGEVRNGRVTHVLDYAPTITVEAGKIYTLSGYVMNPLSNFSPSLRSSSTLEPGGNTIIVSISGIGDEWAQFSTTFFAGESGTYNLALHFADGFEDFGFFVDELRLEENAYTLSELKLSGPDEIIIPATGSIKNYYRPFIITSENENIAILSSSNLNFSVTKAEGIYFNSQEFSLTVTSEASRGMEISIACALRNYTDLAPTLISVTLTDNMIDNPGFESESIPWTSTSDISMHTDTANGYISVPTNDYGDFGYFATITYDAPQVLLKDVFYVIRAKIRSDNPKPFSAIHAKNSAQIDGNTVYFSVKDISGEEWIDVFAAFVPEYSGVYDIALNLCSMQDCTIYIDDIKLSCEVPSPEYITLHAPGNIALPNVSTSYPVSALLRDQSGNILPSDEVLIELLQSDDSIYIDSTKKMLTVNPDTITGTYTLVATYLPNPEIKSTLDFEVSFDYIGDGTFEKTIPNEWWMVTSPYECDLYMRNDGYSRRALINCKGSYFMLLNNSYVHLIENVPYVFNSSFSVPTDCTATLFIETIEGEMLPLAQIFINAGATLDEKRPPELFLAEEDAIGRLFFYIESDNGQPFSIYADNLSLKGASIVAANPHITGKPYVNGAVEVGFTLFNNIAENSDTSACAVNWYISDTQNGVFNEISYGGKNIYFDTTFLNKYVCFEVIPICPITGFSGIPVRSFPFQVTYDPSESNSSLPMFTPVLKEHISSETVFSDIESHWSRNYVMILSQSDVVSGKSEGLFSPDDNVTRAEFSKMLSIAFSINTSFDMPLFYDVKPDDWYYDYVTALHLAGIVNGTSDVSFSPERFLTREEATVIMVRLFEKATADVASVSEYSFTDRESISPWAASSVAKGVSLEIIKGNPDGSFNPRGYLTRGEAAALICRLAEILKKG